MRTHIHARIKAMQRGDVPQGYRKTNVGIIPDDWTVKKLRDIAPLQRGFDLPTQNLVPGQYPVAYSNGVLNFHKDFKVKGPGVFTGRSGTIGKVFYIEEDYWPHNTTLWVTDFKGNDPKFIYYFYRNVNLLRFNAGTSVPTLNRNDVHIADAPLPPFPEQRKIAEILSAWDDAIRLQQELIARKQEQKRGLMQLLLTGAIRVTEMGRISRDALRKRVADIRQGLAPQGYQKTKVGIIPEEWTEQRISKCLTVKYGKEQKGIAEPNGKYPILGTGGVIGQTNAYLYDKPSVLIGRKGTIDKPQFMTTPFWTVDTLFYTQIQQNIACPKWLYYQFW